MNLWGFSDAFMWVAPAWHLDLPEPCAEWITLETVVERLRDDRRPSERVGFPFQTFDTPCFGCLLKRILGSSVLYASSSHRGSPSDVITFGWLWSTPVYWQAQYGITMAKSKADQSRAFGVGIWVVIVSVLIGCGSIPIHYQNCIYWDVHLPICWLVNIES